MKFTKMQGAGNDFVVIDSKRNLDWSKLAIKMCDRHFGIGADGLLISFPSKAADFKMRIFNADGSESAVCGNGLRCLVKHYIDSHKKQNDSRITVETSIGLRQARVRRRKGAVIEIQVNMGEPQIGPDGISLKAMHSREVLDIMSTMNRVIKINGKELLLSLVSIGNPHAVHFYNGLIADFPIAKVGSKVRAGTDFSRMKPISKLSGLSIGSTLKLLFGREE